MDLDWQDDQVEARFLEYVDGLSSCLGHADRVEPFLSYCTGLLLPGKRKSVEPMAARLRPDHTSAAHQSLLHFVGYSPWDGDALLRSVRDAVLPILTRDEAIEAWIIDDTGFPKKGRHSVGVARQYCGQLGKQDNCQVAVSLSVATSQASLPVAWQLYLPESWAEDWDRRTKAKVPETVQFTTKPEIALKQLETALSEGISPGVVLADSGYGQSGAFREGIEALGLGYCVGVRGDQVVWPPGMTPQVPAKGSGPGRSAKRLRQTNDDAPVVRIGKLAEDLPDGTWQDVSWREGVDKVLASRFAALRVHPAHGDHKRSKARTKQWLLIEWPEEKDEPKKFWFSTLPAETPIERLVYLAKLRWLIERDYLELKQELGLGHYEGRGWPGFHHHGALCIAAYGFLVAERARIPPSAAKTARLVEATDLPAVYKPRGSPCPDPAPCPMVNRHHSTKDRNIVGEKTTAMSML